MHSHKKTNTWLSSEYCLLKKLLLEILLKNHHNNNRMIQTRSIILRTQVLWMFCTMFLYLFCQSYFLFSVRTHSGQRPNQNWYLTSCHRVTGFGSRVKQEDIKSAESVFLSINSVLTFFYLQLQNKIKKKKTMLIIILYLLKFFPFLNELNIFHGISVY